MNSSATMEATDAAFFFPEAGIVYGSSLCFPSSLEPMGIKKLYCYTSGTTTITQISNTAGDSYTDDPQNLTLYNGKLFFSSKNSNGYTKLYEYDGSSLPQSANARSDQSFDDIPADRTVFSSDDILYFAGKKQPDGIHLLRYDDSSNTLRWLSCTRRQYSSGNCITYYSSSPEEIIEYNGRLFFAAQNSNDDQKLFYYNHSADLIFQVSNTRQNNSESDSIGSTIIYNDRLFFIGKQSSGYYKLFTLCDPDAGCTP